MYENTTILMIIMVCHLISVPELRHVSRIYEKFMKIDFSKQSRTKYTNMSCFVQDYVRCALIYTNIPE